jgi:molecular chaperone HscA
LSEHEIGETESAIQSLNSLLEKNNKDEIHAGIEKLNEISRPYAERLMDEAISKAIKGKKIME